MWELLTKLVLHADPINLPKVHHGINLVKLWCGDVTELGVEIGHVIKTKVDLVIKLTASWVIHNDVDSCGGSIEYGEGSEGEGDGGMWLGVEI